MSGHASYENVAPDLPRHDVPLVKLTEESFSRFGHLVHDFDEEKVEIVPWPVSGWRRLAEGTGDQGGVTSGDFTYQWDERYCHARNQAVPDGSYITALIDEVSQGKRTSVLVREANYHPDGGQIFFPRNSDPFVLLLAPPGDDVKPSDFISFYCGEGGGVQIDPGVWHQPVYPVPDHAVFRGKQGRVHACVCVDTVEEFGVWLRVSLDARRMRRG